MLSIRSAVLDCVAVLVCVLALATAPASAQQINGEPGSPSATMTLDGKQLPPPPMPFGGTIKEIAKAGLRYTEFHSTALCSPTRAALITGRNHHSVGYGVIGELSTGYPGYDS